MGTLPTPKKMRWMWCGGGGCLPVVVIMMIGMQARMMSCSAGVDLARPYLFRDFGMPSGGYAQFAHAYHQKYQQKQQETAESSLEDELGSSEEEQAQYTAPLILDIDDPEEKSRWLGFNSEEADQSFEEEDDDEDVEPESRSISSTEFRSRSSPEGDDDVAVKADRKSKSNEENREDDEFAASRGLLDFQLMNNPLTSLWNKGDGAPKAEEPLQHDEEDGGDQAENDETYFYAQPYDYDPYEMYSEGALPQSPVPMRQQSPPPTTKSKPKPKRKPSAKPKQKKESKQPRPPPMWIRNQPHPPHPRPPPGHHGGRRPLSPPRHPPQMHSTEDEEEQPKPGKLAMISNKLAKLNPLRLITSKKAKPEPPRKPEKPEKPEMVMILGEPFNDFTDDEKKKIEDDNQDEDQDEEDAADDDKDDENNDEDDAEDDEEDGDDKENEEDEEEDDAENDSPVTLIHNPSNEELTALTGTGASSFTQDEVQFEQDAEDDEDAFAAQGTSTRQRTPDKREKSILDGHLVKFLSFGRKKKHRRPRRKPRPHKHIPARRPPNWKQYEPAPLIPEVVGDTILKVVKNFGILPEYEKNEKYGGHNKIKGKFTKTRPITLHHGLLTEVLRRR